MIYRLMRIHHKRGEIFGEITLDLWNHEYNTGYEIKFTVWKYLIYLDDDLKYLHNLVGFTYDISYWDKIIRDIKQHKRGETK